MNFFLAGIRAEKDAYSVVHTQPVLVDLQRGVCMKVNSAKTCLSPLRIMCAPHTFSTLRNQESPVNGQALFTADHGLFTLQWHVGPWVLFQLSEQRHECWCSHVGGSLSDLQDSVREAGMRGREGEGEKQSETVCPQLKTSFMFSIQKQLNRKMVESLLICSMRQNCASYLG